MKKIHILLFGLAVVLSSLTEVHAQRSILIYDNEDIGDSTIVDLSHSHDVYKWEGFYVEALFESLTANDTTAKVEVYSTLNNDYTDATDLDSFSLLLAADSAGGTGTIMKTAYISNSYLENLRFVCDPDVDDSGSGKVTVRIKPIYKSNYTAPK